VLARFTGMERLVGPPIQVGYQDDPVGYGRRLNAKLQQFMDAYSTGLQRQIPTDPQPKITAVNGPRIPRFH